MKNAEDFRRSIGTADEAFVCGIRQTLMDLEREEEHPVKRKISLGLVLAAVVILLTVTAFAATQWGILDFIRDQGREPAVYKLVTEIPQQEGYSRWVDVDVEEALIDGDKAYLTMTIHPKMEKTMMVPMVEDVNAPESMAMLSGVVCDGGTTIMTFAESKGFERVMGVTMEKGEVFGELTNAAYESLENGALRCVMEYNYAGKTDFPEQRVYCFQNFLVRDYKEVSSKPDPVRVNDEEWFQMELEIPVNICQETRRSRAEDIHDIAGYKGVIEHIAMTPMQDGGVQFTMLVNLNDAEKREMYFPTAALMDENGQQLYWLNGRAYNMGISNKYLWESAIPAEYARAALADNVIIQVYGLGEPITVYDTYTYTLE